MLTPCSPCVCPGCPCEQCTFGYQSKENNHERMKKILLAYIAEGKNAYGWQTAELYLQFHSDWKKELGMGEIPDKHGNIASRMMRPTSVTEAYRKYEQLASKICSLLPGIDSLEDLERYLAAGWHLEPPENDRIVRFERYLRRRRGLIEN